MCASASRLMDRDKARRLRGGAFPTSFAKSWHPQNCRTLQPTRLAMEPTRLATRSFEPKASPSMDSPSNSTLFSRTTIGPDPTTTVPLFLHKKSLLIHARPLIHHVRPGAEDDMPVRLPSRSPTYLLIVDWTNCHCQNMARNWTSGHVLSSVKTSCCERERPKGADDAETMLNERSVPMGGEWSWLSRWQSSVSR